MTPLRKARFEKELTQCGLMLKTGIPQCRISLLEKGYYHPKPDEAQKIAKALRMRVEEVFPKEKGKK